MVKSPLLDIGRCEIENFTDSHSSSGYEFRHKPVSDIHSSKDDLIDGLLIGDIPLNSLGSFEDFSDDRGIARIGESQQAVSG
jgi:hypothetical protein